MMREKGLATAAVGRFCAKHCFYNAHMKEAGILVGVDREELLSWGMLGWGSLPYLGQQDVAVRIVCNHQVPGS